MTRKVQQDKLREFIFLCRLWNRVRAQYGHLVGRDSLKVGLILAGGAARCGSVGWGGGAGGVTGHAAATAGGGGGGGADGEYSGLLLFGLLTGELCDAKDKLEATQFDVAAMMEQGRTLPTRPATTNQAGAARLAAA